MKNRILTIAATSLLSLVALFVLIGVVTSSGAGADLAALDAPLVASPMVTGADPSAAPNDLDTSIVITGTGFADGVSGYLGDTALESVTWISSTLLHATVPWGMNTGVYTLTVANPNGGSGSLVDAFTVTEGIGTWKTGGPYGGWIYSLALGDSQGETVYATVTNVGLFRSRDGGASWELIFIEIGYLNEPEIDPTNPNRLYIAKQIHEQAGLYRSEDGGDTWTAMPQPIPGVNPRVFLAFINPHDGTLFGALRIDMDDPACDHGCGLFRFDETSQTWTRLEENGLLDENTGVTAVAFDPEDPGTMYAGLVGGQVLKSFDSGDTWSSHSQTPLSFIHRLVVNPVSNELWISSPGHRLPGGLYRYDGNAWVSMYSSPREFTEIKDIIFDPDAANVQTQRIWIAANFDGVLKSEDGGQTWMHVTPNRAEAAALNPMYPETIYSGSNEGVSKTNDGGANWQTINEGLTGIVPYHMGVSPHDPAVVFGVADSIGIFGSRNGGETWQRRTVSTGGPIVVDPVDPLHVVNADYDMLRIADDGWNFNREIPISLPPGMATEDYSVTPNAMIARPGLWLMGVGYGDRALPYWNYEGGGGIYLSEDGENWTWIVPIQTCPLTGFAFDPVEVSTLYATTMGVPDCEGGTFLRSTDAGQTWQESTAGLPPGIGGLLAVEPTPPYRIYLASGGGLWVSSDQGVTWNRTNSPFSAVWISSLHFLEGSPNILYAGTGVGLFRSMDGAQTWQRAQGIMGQLEVWSMAGTTIGDRQVLYVANIGVYRYTTLSWGGRVYLPLVMRVE